MPFTIPNFVHGATYPALSEPDSVDFDALVAGFNQTGVVSGCAVTAQGSPNMTVAVAGGTISSAGGAATVTAGNVTITAAHATYARFDLVVASSTGILSAVAGTPLPSAGVTDGVTEEAVYPPIPAGSVLLAAVYIPANATTITSAQIVDKRVILVRDPRYRSVTLATDDGPIQLSNGVPGHSSDWGGLWAVPTVPGNSGALSFVTPYSPLLATSTVVSWIGLYGWTAGQNQKTELPNNSFFEVYANYDSAGAPWSQIFGPHRGRQSITFAANMFTGFGTLAPTAQWHFVGNVQVDGNLYSGPVHSSVYASRDNQPGMNRTDSWMEFWAPDGTTAWDIRNGGQARFALGMSVAVPIELYNGALFYGGTIHSDGPNACWLYPRNDGMYFWPQAASQVPLIVVGLLGGGQTGSLAEFRTEWGGTVLSRVDKHGYYMTRKLAAPADGDLASSELAFWLDATPGATKANFKAKDSVGVVRSGSVALA